MSFSFISTRSCSFSSISILRRRMSSFLATSISSFSYISLSIFVYFLLSDLSLSLWISFIYLSSLLKSYLTLSLSRLTVRFYYCSVAIVFLYSFMLLSKNDRDFSVIYLAFSSNSNLRSFILCSSLVLDRILFILLPI